MENSIFIVTRADDYHAAAVTTALRSVGVEPQLLFSSDFPSAAKASISYEHDQSQIHIGTNRSAPTVFWFRRYDGPVLNSPIATEDRPTALRESRSFLRCLFDDLGAKAISINKVDRSFAAEVKVNQLRAAARSGFKLPKTLLSNDPSRIHAFVSGNANGTIYKMFRLAQWRRDDVHVLTSTSKVTIADLPANEVLQATPGIFQEFVPKAYELRVTCFGGRAIAAKIHSQSVKGAETDWRVVSSELLNLQPFELPTKVSAACLQVLQELDLSFGAIDLIVTPQGDYVFLEVNEMGQFLWKELRNPNIQLLRPFTAFLLSVAGIAFKYSDLPCLSDIQDETGSLVKSFGQQHVIAQVVEQMEMHAQGKSDIRAINEQTM